MNNLKNLTDREKKLTAAVAVLASTNIVYIGIARYFYTQFLKQKRNYNRLYEMSLYMMDLCEKQDLEIDEFDIIAIKAINQGMES